MRRVVQESVSFLYADHGDAWIGEDAPVEITRATEPASVGESHVQEYTCGSRAGVVLRLGTIIGDDPLHPVPAAVAAARAAIGLGSPDGWAHVVHTDDLGPAVLAALYGAERCLQRRRRAGASLRAGGRLLRRRRTREHRLRRTADAQGRMGGPASSRSRARCGSAPSTSPRRPAGPRSERKFDSAWFEGLPSRQAV